MNVNIVCPLAWTAQLENFEAAYPEAFEANVRMPPVASMAAALHCQARKTRAPGGAMREGPRTCALKTLTTRCPTS